VTVSVSDARKPIEVSKQDKLRSSLNECMRALETKTLAERPKSFDMKSFNAPGPLLSICIESYKFEDSDAEREAQYCTVPSCEADETTGCEATNAPDGKNPFEFWHSFDGSNPFVSDTRYSAKSAEQRSDSDPIKSRLDK